VRQLERSPGGAGIVLDDVMAGIYAGLVLFAAGWFNLY
jgi:phosphatidylglycerophosphatase A